MIEQITWFVATCIGSVLGTFLCVWVGNFLQKVFK